MIFLVSETDEKNGLFLDFLWPWWRYLTNESSSQAAFISGCSLQ